MIPAGRPCIHLQADQWRSWLFAECLGNERAISMNHFQQCGRVLICLANLWPVAIIWPWFHILEDAIPQGLRSCLWPTSFPLCKKCPNVSTCLDLTVHWSPFPPAPHRKPVRVRLVSNVWNVAIPKVLEQHLLPGGGSTTMQAWFCSYLHERDLAFESKCRIDSVDERSADQTIHRTCVEKFCCEKGEAGVRGRDHARKKSFDRLRF
jgi:hypothetical protein